MTAAIISNYVNDLADLFQAEETSPFGPTDSALVKAALRLFARAVEAGTTTLDCKPVEVEAG